MKRIFLLSIWLLTLTGLTHAQELIGDAPNKVEVGQHFKIKYIVNTHDASNLELGLIPKAFEELMGPSTSKQTSFSLINGKTTSDSTKTYSYILEAKREGTFTIPPAQITAKGKVITSNALEITVNKATDKNQNSKDSTGNYSTGNYYRVDKEGTPITKDDLFITVTADKHRVMEQEPIKLTYKIYTLVQLTQLDGKMPDFTNYLVKEVPLPQEKSFQIEEYNGKNYRTVTWSQYYLFPMTTGKLQIPENTFNGTVLQANKNADPFEAFFKGGSIYVEVKKQIVAPSVEIEVKPLPQSPQNFSGGVGSFDISVELDKQNISLGDTAYMHITVSGTGNLPLIELETPSFPQYVKASKVDETEDIKVTEDGVSGEIHFDYSIVPQQSGIFKIPSVKFTYFDTKTKRYKTIYSKSLILNVKNTNIIKET